MARVAVRLEDAEQPLGGRTANVSEGGFFVSCEDPHPVGTLVRFELDFGGGESAEGFAEVVWLRTEWHGARMAPGMGVQFRFVSGPGRRLLRKHVLAALGGSRGEAPGAPNRGEGG